MLLPTFVGAAWHPLSNISDKRDVCMCMLEIYRVSTDDDVAKRRKIHSRNFNSGGFFFFQYSAKTTRMVAHISLTKIIRQIRL